MACVPRIMFIFALAMPTRMKNRFCRLSLAALVFAVLLSSCRSSKKAEIPSRQDPTEHAVPSGRLSDVRRNIIKEAKTWLGTPYVYAAQEKGSGTDCSGMVMQVFLLVVDCRLPRNSAKQAEYCRRIRAEEAIAGDLVFFATGKDPKRVSHVGILVDEDSFIHASSSKGVVVSRLSNQWYSKRLLMYGRVPALDKN
ncbi:MAG TPA: hydrolase Nlp/P60 [Porphyromonadaceae bacterium]|nr:hydrolase Nlp/P60 [Porphyromonadaceae bacterium]